MKPIFCSPDGGAEFFDIVTGVLQKNTLVTNMFIICLDDVHRVSIDIIKVNGFTQEKAKSRQDLADYADDLALLSNTSAQFKSLLPSLEQVAEGIGLYIQVKQIYKNQRQHHYHPL